MAVSDTVSNTVFIANKVVDTAFRRCRIPMPGITAEMQSYALDALYLWLSELANSRTPSWCIEKIILPMYQGQPTVQLPVGTVNVLNLNYRVLQALEVIPATTPTSYSADLTDPYAVTCVGVKWAGASVNLTFEASEDELTWVTVGTQETSASVGEWTWTDIAPANAYRYFRVSSVDPLLYSTITLGSLYQEIPFGKLNRDTFSAQSFKMFQGRPTTYWFQRDRVTPVLNLWPAPNLAAEQHQLVVWRHRHIMDTPHLRLEVEVPQRWMEAMTAGLAAKVAAETPAVDIALIPMLDQKAVLALKNAWDGDSDGSSTYIQPSIGCYTR